MNIRRKCRLVKKKI